MVGNDGLQELSNFGVGVNYLRYCEYGASDSRQLLEALRDLLAGKSNLILESILAIRRQNGAGSI